MNAKNHMGWCSGKYTQVCFLHTSSLFHIKGAPTKSILMCENGGEGVTFSSGSGPIFRPTCFLWQITHFLVMRLTWGLPWVLQSLCLKVESKVSGLACNCGHLVSTLQLLYVHVARLFDVLFLQECQWTVIVHLFFPLDQFCHSSCSWIMLLQLSTACSLYMHHVEPTYSISTLLHLFSWQFSGFS